MATAEGSWCARSYVSEALLAARPTAAYSPGRRGLAGGHRGSGARGDRRSTWNRGEPMFTAWTYCLGLVGTVGTTALNSPCVGDTATSIRGLRLHGPRQELPRMRDSHDEQMPDRSILVARHGSGLWAPMRTPACRSYLRSPEGFESDLVVSDGRGVPRRGGAGRLRIRRDGAQHRQRRVIGHGPTVREQPRPDPLDIRTGPVVASAAHPCGRRSMHARSAARYAIGPQLAFGRSGFRAPAFHVEPGRPRCSGLEDAAWALGA